MEIQIHMLQHIDEIMLDLTSQLCDIILCCETRVLSGIKLY